MGGVHGKLSKKKNHKIFRNKTGERGGKGRREKDNYENGDVLFTGKTGQFSIYICAVLISYSFNGHTSVTSEF